MDNIAIDTLPSAVEAGSPSDSGLPVATSTWNPLSILELVSERVVFADPKDLTELVELHTIFTQFAADASEHEAPLELAHVSILANGAISQIILEECADPRATMAELGKMIDFMGHIVRTGIAGPLPKEWQQFDEQQGQDTPAEHSEKTVGTDFGTQEFEAADDMFCNDPELLREFLQEANEHLEAAEVNLLSLESDPDNKDAIDAVFRAFHTVKGAAGFLKLNAIQSLSHVAESLLDKVRQGAIRMEGEAIDLSLEATDGLKRLVAAHQGGEKDDDTAENDWLHELVAMIDVATHQAVPGKRLGAIMVERGATTEEAVEAALNVQADLDPKPRLGEVLVASGSATVRDTVDAIRAQKEQRRPVTGQRESIKVDADRLDQLVDLIGELVIAESMVRQSDEILDDPMSALARRIGHMDKITRELQSISMSLRMVPVRATFQKMARLVRDLAKKFGKEVDFVTEGDDTDLDKNVVDMVADPLMHMVRNAIDHGVETPEEREAAGKPRKSKVMLRAYHEGGGIYIEIVDDGRGLDREAILAKAIDRGLVAPGDNLAESDIWQLIFHPGLSTAKKVTDVSGRGVGMDVVLRNIKALHGTVEIHSEKGVGSTFSIRLPLTLAIIDGMTVQVGDERFIVPIENVIRATRPTADEVHTVRGKGEVLHQHNKLIPLFRLHRIMDIPNAIQHTDQGIILILEDNNHQIGLLADELIGQQQVVIKPLGKAIGAVQGLAGSAIMPDGRVGLILDTAGLFQSARAAAVADSAVDTTAGGNSQ